MSQFFKKLDYVDIGRVRMDLDDAEKEHGVRLYCTQSGSWWHLQLRAHRKLADHTLSKEFMIATASLDRDTMLSLRDAINDALGEDES
jgi:hypothetical protein